MEKISESLLIYAAALILFKHTPYELNLTRAMLRLSLSLFFKLKKTKYNNKILFIKFSRKKKTHLYVYILILIQTQIRS